MIKRFDHDVTTALAPVDHVARAAALALFFDRAEWWSNNGQMVVISWSNGGQIIVKWWPNDGQIVLEWWPND